MVLNCCNIVLLALGIFGGVLIIVGSVLGFAVFPSIIDDQIVEKVQLKSGTTQFDQWQKTPMPFTFKVYIFNIKNVDDIMQGEKPIIEEVGPYVYTQTREKLNVEYTQNVDTLTYTHNLKYEFDEEASFPLQEDDELTVLNVALQEAMLSVEGTTDVEDFNKAWERVFQDTTTIFHKIKISDLLFDGYRFCDPTTLQGPAFNSPRVVCTKIRDRVKDSATASDTTTLDEETVVFSFFKHKTLKDDGPYVIKAGNVDVHEVGAIQSWKDVNNIDMWTGGEQATTTGDICNNIRGRDFSIYPPFNNDTSKFDVFNSDICRIVTLQTKYMSSYEGILGYVAKLGPETFSNVGDAKCYCTKAAKNLNGEHECFPEGFGDLSTCVRSPFIMSFPHFLWADYEYSSTVQELTPNEEEHATFVMIEPATGTLLQGAKRMQFNMVIRPIDGIDVVQFITPTMMPILWVEEGVNLSDDLVQQLNDEYFDTLIMMDAVTYTLIGVGIFLLVSGCGGFLFRIYSRKNTLPTPSKSPY